MPRPTIGLLLLLALSAARGLCAQDPPPGPGPQPLDRAAKAIADYVAVKGDSAKAALQRQALLWVGEIDAPETTEFLRQELQAAARSPFTATVIEAIGKVARPALRDDLHAVLTAKAMSTALRVAAAGEIVKLGDRAMDNLLELAAAMDEVAPVAVRDAAITALIDSKSSRAHRGLVPLLSHGVEADQLKLLRRLSPVHGLSPLSQARIKFVREGTLALAACAWRQLTVEGHERAKDLTVDVLERVLADPPPPVAADLIGGLVRVRDADFYPALLRFGAVPGGVVRNALKEAAPEVAKDPALMRWLLAKGLDDSRPAAREAAKMLLLEAPPEAVQPLVERIRADLRTKKTKALDAAAGLHEILARDPTWRRDLVTLATSADVETRLLGLSLLLEIGAPVGIGPAQQSLGHAEWQLRSLAYRYLTKCRDVGSIPLLIARFGKEEGRLADELGHALFAHTGTRCWTKKEWEKWWEGARLAFVLPHADTVKRGGGNNAGQTASYHGIPVVSSRLSFVVDRSGSMNERLGTDKKFTRLEAAKEQLALVLQALPATHHVNLIVYETEVFPLWKELRPLSDDNRKLLLDTAKKIPLGQGTNIFEALEVAFLDPTIDTIYLLTDGQPSVGRVRDPDDIVDEVRRWNRQRQIVIHCIGLGIDSVLLQQLASNSGGTYKYVR